MDPSPQFNAKDFTVSASSAPGFVWLDCSDEVLGPEQPPISPVPNPTTTAMISSTVAVALLLVLTS